MVTDFPTKNKLSFNNFNNLCKKKRRQFCWDVVQFEGIVNILGLAKGNHTVKYPTDLLNSIVNSLTK